MFSFKNPLLDVFFDKNACLRVNIIIYVTHGFFSFLATPLPSIIFLAIISAVPNTMYELVINIVSERKCLSKLQSSFFLQELTKYRYSFRIKIKINKKGYQRVYCYLMFSRKLNEKLILFKKNKLDIRMRIIAECS